MVETRSDAEAKRKVWEMIKDVEIAMMVTMDEEGRFRGRPMRASQKEFDGVLWFFTQAGSPKTGEVAQDERCLLAYSDPRGQNYVSIYGVAELVRDVEQQKRLWAEPLRVWFPGGAESPEVALLKVTCEGAEYWDSPSSTLVHAYGYIKAVTTGEPPHPGANDKVDFTKKAG
ncbi:pyridoxamine 5'-phosphate oxidase family protein [Paracraurococcus ruber]|uniref:General stress protein n=1 Tax=Paracraurococcus ruber TaxID=77675 RepID=A0ABS1D9F9_9PROT|nr:pyridoxamine 5'-phosphate oxidase family protein [Paracraurococcus ruber]MBK1662857.1 general stress protein [Paracraurococcus ruber]TDG29044.1 general stress protein [Paracraurococcus ruber]